MNDATRLALELLATVDALRNVLHQIDRLHRDGHSAVADCPEAVILYCSAPSIALALETLAERLGHRSNAR
jgi:hypothetical protein